jgi:hypothetical protein
VAEFDVRGVSFANGKHRSRQHIAFVGAGVRWKDLRKQNAVPTPREGKHTTLDELLTWFTP